MSQSRFFRAQKWELSICNTGDSDLTWGGSTHVISAAGVTSKQALDLVKGEPDPGPGVLGSGGPDGTAGA